MGFSDIEDRFSHHVHNARGVRVRAYGSLKLETPKATVESLADRGWVLAASFDSRWVPFLAQPLRSVEHTPSCWLWEKNGAMLYVAGGWSKNNAEAFLKYQLCAPFDLFDAYWLELKQWFVSSPLPNQRPDPNTVPVEFAFMSGEGPAEHSRLIEAPRWKDIADNYPAPVRDKLQALVETQPGDLGAAGSIVLLHGEPGTGKTTFLRSLVREWTEWTNAIYVIDPEVLFGDSSYLHTILSDAMSDEMDDDGRWRVLILEDVGEFIREKSTTAGVSQAFARLLNTSDGFLGQGTRLLIVLTTNVPVHDITPALTRPGRCLADVEVRPFKRDEASAWLGHAPVDSTAQRFSLASLYEEKNDTKQVKHKEASPSTGQYI